MARILHLQLRREKESTPAITMQRERFRRRRNGARGQAGPTRSAHRRRARDDRRVCQSRPVGPPSHPLSGKFPERGDPHELLHDTPLLTPEEEKQSKSGTGKSLPSQDAVLEQSLTENRIISHRKRKRVQEGNTNEPLLATDEEQSRAQRRRRGIAGGKKMHTQEPRLPELPVL